MGVEVYTQIELHVADNHNVDAMKKIINGVEVDDGEDQSAFRLTLASNNVTIYSCG